MTTQREARIEAMEAVHDILSGYLQGRSSMTDLRVARNHLEKVLREELKGYTPESPTLLTESRTLPVDPMFVSVGGRSFNLRKIVSFVHIDAGAVRIWFDESAGGCNSTITPKEYKTLVGKMVEAGLWLD